MADAYQNVINILFLGETGVGKSTFINAFVNYLTYDTMGDAEVNDFIGLIPSSFTITDDDFEIKKIEFGNDQNESTDTSQSATQSCKSYIFPFENYTIRMIDTPGVGDTREIERDDINFENILAFIGQYEDLHAICILLKPNNSKLTVSFKYCIKQLLCHLEKSAANNILFLYTNSRQTNYRPGETSVPLKKLLDTVKENPPHVDIAYKKDTVFCFDSEAFRFLVACKNGVKFTEKDRVNYEQSWAKASNECQRLIKKIIGDGQTNGLVPHKVQNTVSVNEARRRILLLQQPIGDVTQSIQANLRALNRHQNEINANMDDIEKLISKLYVPIIDLKITIFDQPRTVCAGNNCRDVIVVDDVKKYHYKTICHNPCYLTGVTKEIIGDTALRKCEAMEKDITAQDVNCLKCTCSYKLHMHIYYDTELIEVIKEDKNVSKRIKTKEDAQREAMRIAHESKERMVILKQEQQIITEIIAKFAHFLKNNAIVPYNDAFKDYLKYLIKDEEIMPNKSEDYINGLRDLLYSYELQKNILEREMRQSGTSNVSPVTAENILNMTDQLYGLKIMGEKLRESFEAQEKGRKMENYSFQEMVVKPKNGISFKSAFNYVMCLYTDEPKPSPPLNKLNIIRDAANAKTKIVCQPSNSRDRFRQMTTHNEFIESNGISVCPPLVPLNTIPTVVKETPQQMSLSQPLPPPSLPPPPANPVDTVSIPPPPSPSTLLLPSTAKGVVVEEKSDPRSDLMAAIRAGIKLKRVADCKQKQVEKSMPFHDVASSLARRVAMELSDSDHDNDDDDDSDPWDNESEY